MDTNKEKWINDVFDSFKGKEELTPSDHVFENIEKEISKISQEKVINLRMFIMAASFVLALNIIAISKYATIESKTQLSSNESSLIIDYNMYEYE